jgi:hypothetical protein
LNIETSWGDDPAWSGRSAGKYKSSRPSAAQRAGADSRSPRSPSITSTGAWPGEVIALAELAAHLCDGQQLLGGLDALGEHLHRQRTPDADDRLQQIGALLALLEGRDESAVDLEDVGRHALELCEGGVSRAEVIERNAHPRPFICSRSLQAAAMSRMTVVSVISSSSEDGRRPVSVARRTPGRGPRPGR